MRIPVLEALQTGQLHQLGDTVTDDSLTGFLHFQAKGDILEHRHMLEQRIILEDEADLTLLRRKMVHRPAVEDNLAAIRRLKARQHPQDGGFATAAWAEQPDQMAFGNAEMDILHRMKIAKMLIESTDLYMHN